jgi:hypothetical protein
VLRRPWLLMLLALVAMACAKKQPAEVTPTGAPAYVEVDNKYALPVEIFAIGGGTTFRLGIVHPGMRGSFHIPQPVFQGGSIELTATPTSRGPTYRSTPILVSPGAVIDLNVASVLFNSTATIRP